MHFSTNDRALAIIEEQILPYQEELRVRAHTMKNGAMLIDMGVEEDGGFQSGKLFTEVSLGGLGEVTFQTCVIRGTLMGMAGITVDRPAIAELSNHDAVSHAPYRGKMQTYSGPIRAIKADDFYASGTPYRDPHPKKVIACVQIDHVPDDELAEAFAEKTGYSTKDIIILATRTGTLAGEVNILARSVEQIFPSLRDLGFPVNNVVQASGYAPMTAIAEDEVEAYGRVNDCMMYGQESNMICDCEDEDIEKILPGMAFVVNDDIYGMTFKEFFAMCDNDWAKMPRQWDRPCKVNFFNVRTGNKFVVGKRHEGILTWGFFGGEYERSE